MAPPNRKIYRKIDGQLFMNINTGDICLIYSEFLRKKIGNIKGSVEYEEILYSHRKPGGAEIRKRIAVKLLDCANIESGKKLSTNTKKVM